MCAAVRLSQKGVAKLKKITSNYSVGSLCFVDHLTDRASITEFA